MENQAIRLNQIGQFNVTDRPLNDSESTFFSGSKSISEIFHLKKRWVNSLPPNAVLLNIGSGVRRLFEKEIKQRRKDIKIVSIDPTLAIKFKDDTNGWYIEEYGQGDNLVYKTIDKEKTDSTGYRIPEDLVTYQKDRVAKAAKIPGAIAGLAPELPIRDNSIDIFFDSFGPVYYLKDPQKSQEYLVTLGNVLKPNGVGYITYIGEAELAFLKSRPNLRVDILEPLDIEVDNEPKRVNTIKITKTV